MDNEVFLNPVQENVELHSSSTRELEATIERLQAALDAQNRLQRPVCAQKHLPSPKPIVLLVLLHRVQKLIYYQLYPGI